MLEFWIDVRCTGELRKTYSEICVRRFEVVDTGHALPAPMKTGASPTPVMPGDEVEDSALNEGDDVPSPKPKKAKKKTQDSDDDTPPRLSKKEAQKKSA